MPRWMRGAALSIVASLALGCNAVLGLDARDHAPRDAGPTADGVSPGDCDGDAYHAFCDDFDRPRTRKLVIGGLGKASLGAPAFSLPAALVCSLDKGGPGEAMLHAAVAPGTPTGTASTSRLTFRLWLDPTAEKPFGEVRLASLVFLEGKWTVHLVYGVTSTTPVDPALAFQVISMAGGASRRYPEAGGASLKSGGWSQVTMEVVTSASTKTATLRLSIDGGTILDLPAEPGGPMDSSPSELRIGLATDTESSATTARFDDVTLDL